MSDDASPAGASDEAPTVLWPVPETDEERAARCALLRTRLAPDCAADEHVARFCTDATLERFTRAMSYDVDKAEEFMRRALRWRGEKQPWAATCPGCAATPRAHSLRCIGTDAAGRPVRALRGSAAERTRARHAPHAHGTRTPPPQRTQTPTSRPKAPTDPKPSLATPPPPSPPFPPPFRQVLYHCFAQADGRHVAAHNTAHLMRILEDCVALMDAAEPQVPQWVWIFDFHGYGLWDNNPSTVLAAAQFLPMHPNRLFKVIMLDAPTAFSAVWSVVSGFLTDITKAKITFCALPELRAATTEWAGEEVATWLAAEAGENRRLTAAGAKAASSKCYWKAPGAQLGAAGAAGADAGAAPAHDARGVASFVDSPAYFSPAMWGGAAADAAAAAGGPPGGGEGEGGEGGAAPAPAARGSWLWGGSSAAAG
jgi:hypothetical protein